MTAGPDDVSHVPRLPREAGFALAAAAAAFVGAALVLRLHHITLHVPLVYSGDVHQQATVVKGTIDHGWYLRNTDVGAPHGQNLLDYPFETAAAVDVALVNILGLGTPDAFVVVNLFFLLMFPVVALSAHLVLRALGISAAVAAVCSVLYALLPYHFLRGEGHLFLQAYYAVPVAGYLVLKILGDRPLFERRTHRRGLRAFASRTSVSTLLLCLVVGTGGTYYAAFSLVLLVAATVFAGLATRRLRVLASGVACVAAVGGVVAVQLLPILVHRLRNGAVEASVRMPFQSELYGLKLADLVLPLQSHRLEFLGDVSRRYVASTPLPSEGGGTLGAAATIGLLALFAVALATIASGGSWRPRTPLLGHSRLAPSQRSWSRPRVASPP